MIWTETYSEETLNAAWASMNSPLRHVTLVDYEAFIDRAVDSHLVTAPMDAFEAMKPENTCQLDPVDEKRVDELVASAKLKTLGPQQPVILGRFHDRTVILTGNTRYRAALQLNSDIRYLIIDFNEHAVCSSCWIA
jgi:hypothetical protein